MFPLQPPPLTQPRLVFYRVLELAVGHDPVRYRDLVSTTDPDDPAPATRQPRETPELGPPAGATTVARS